MIPNGPKPAKSLLLYSEKIMYDAFDEENCVWKAYISSSLTIAHIYLIARIVSLLDCIQCFISQPTKIT